MGKGRKTKKGPRAWRKIDMSEVIDARLKATDIMLAGGKDPSAQKPAFSIDKSKSKVSKPSIFPIDPMRRKELARSRVLKVDQLIQPNRFAKSEKSGHVFIPEPTKRQKRKLEQITKHDPSDKLSTTYYPPQIEDLPATLFVAKSERAQKPIRAACVPVPHSSSDKTDITVFGSEDGVYDLWDDRTEELDQYKKQRYEELDLDLLQPALKKPKLYSRPYVKPNQIPAIEVAHPGTSYIPDEEAHKALLQEAVSYWTEKAEKEQTEASRMPKKAQPEPLVWYESDSESEIEEIGEDGQIIRKPKPEAPASDVAPVRRIYLSDAPRKSDKERAKELRRRIHKAEVRKSKRIKQLRQVWKTKFEAAVEKVDKTLESQMARAQQRAETIATVAPFRTERFGTNRIVDESQPTVLYTEELPTSLRHVRSAGSVPKTTDNTNAESVDSVIKDRYKSLIKRNLVIPKSRRQRRMSEGTKEFTRMAHRTDIPVFEED